MPFTRKILVVAHQTAASDDLVEALRHQAEQGKCRFTLIVPAPATTPADQVKTTMEGALARMREAGLQNVEGRVGDPDPIVAVMDVWDPMKFDEVIVSTLPTDESRWIELELPERIAKLTGAPVTHVVSTEVAPFAPIPTA